MADIVDVATALVDFELENRILQLRRLETPSLFECKECGEEIPEKRRRLGSVTLCFECQTKLESKQKSGRS